MASGTLAIANPLATTWTNIYTVPAGKVATVNIRFTNLSTSNTTLLRAAISQVAGAPSSNSEYFEPVDYPLEGSEILEDIGMVMGAGDILKVYANTVNVAVRVHGFEANQ